MEEVSSEDVGGRCRNARFCHEEHATEIIECNASATGIRPQSPDSCMLNLYKTPTYILNYCNGIENRITLLL